ncbi:MAG: DUF5117 domain-containing protein, partial [Gemmatimonadetes bacterium]|nr:DUF5117 domain-containing protein [Gemmatimonadota bacterium]NIV82034.1 DUF5117 domain-containing protein [Gemmatimonadota bacterium]NIY38736.1 DUF5117 domain-containing protein [Gemmatimonadota bacterium]
MLARAVVPALIALFLAPAVPGAGPDRPHAGGHGHFWLAAVVHGPSGVAAQDPDRDQRPPTIAAHTGRMDTRAGYLPLHWDEAEGRLLVEVPRLDEEFLYLTSLATGVGSNRLGLDRGEIDSEFLARFERTGPKVFLVLRNPTFRVENVPPEADPRTLQSLRRSVEESFPTSTVGAFEIVAEEGGRVLVDMTAFFLRDAVGVSARLRATNQGSYGVDEDRSRIHLAATKAFPENTEVEAALTFTADDPGGEVRRHSPDGRTITVRQHHSFVKLPAPGFRPRRFDPRIGLFGVRFFDYGSALDEGYVKRYAIRHRLEKRDPDAEMSEPVEPIVYYLDPAVPEPYRSAFVEGGMWWNEVFEAAGFRNAFRIEDMPPDMDPLDARYNVIQWVHRTEAGSSIGPSFVDPRTGEIIKAAVRMDSHRSLVDFNLWAGTVPATALGSGARGGSGGLRRSGAGSPSGGPGNAPWRGDAEVFMGSRGELDWLATLDPDVDAEEFAMARRRQHSAHEIGHTLGLAHNFIAASYGRASVMDYPAPLIELEDGRITLRDAYRDGPGLYDTLAIRYGYTPFPEGREEEGLEAIVREAEERGALFITNPNAAASDAYPAASTWINGSDVLSELERVAAVRRFLIDAFDETAIDPGEPMWRLNERFVPVYLHHRYTLTAAIKSLGGMEYSYAVRGDSGPPTRIVSADRQRRALDLLASALRPAELAIPEEAVRIMAPRPFGYAPDQRAFATRGAPAFDQLGAARTLAEMIVGGILHPRRMARLAAFHERDGDLPAPEEVVARLVSETWGRPARGDHAGLVRVAQRVVVDRLIELAARDDAPVEARAAAEW